MPVEPASRVEVCISREIRTAISGRKAPIPGVHGIKEYSDWPTIPQLYVGGEFIGGCDIVTELYQSGELSKTLASSDS